MTTGGTDEVVHWYVWFNKGRFGLCVNLQNIVEVGDVNHEISLTQRWTCTVVVP